MFTKAHNLYLQPLNEATVCAYTQTYTDNTTCLSIVSNPNTELN